MAQKRRFKICGGALFQNNIADCFEVEATIYRQLRSKNSFLFANNTLQRVMH